MNRKEKFSRSFLLCSTHEHAMLNAMQIHVFNDNHKKFKRISHQDMERLTLYSFKHFYSIFFLFHFDAFLQHFMHTYKEEEKQSGKSTSHFELFL